MKMKFFKSNLLYFIIVFLYKVIVTNGNIPDQTLKFIIKTYIEDLISTTEVIDDILKKKLLLLSDYIVSHPALYQSHFYVGSEPPKYEPHTNSQSDSVFLNKVKKNFEMLIKRQNLNISTEEVDPNTYPPDEICSTNKKWEQIDVAHDFYENQVKIVQEPEFKQYIYTYRCANKEPCVGILPIFKSECTERNGIVILLFENNNKKRQWGPVQVPHHCACKIQRIFSSSTEETMKKKRQIE